MINNYHDHSNLSNNEEELILPNFDVENLIVRSNVQDQEKICEEMNNILSIKSSKRKREFKSTTNITTSMSQISISHIRKKTRKHLMPVVNAIEYNNNNTNTTTSDAKPKYLKIPDQIFKQMLLKSSSSLSTESECFAHLFDTSAKLQYIRTYVHLLNNICYLKLEVDFWDHYNSVATTEGIWSSPLDKEILKNNNLYRIKFKTKAQLEKRRQLILNRLQMAENELTKHRQREQQEQQLNNDSFDMNKLSTILLAFVRQQQYKLVKEFERKKLFIQFDANDYRLIKTFYDLKPLENQITSAKIIWQATKDKLRAEEEVAMFKQRIYTKQLPSSFHTLDHSIDNIEQILQRPAINQNKRVSISSCRLKTIAQFKYDMMVLTIRAAEETVRGYTSIIMNEKQKLMDSVHEQIPLSKTLVQQLLNIIMACQTNMLKHDLSSHHILPTSPIIEVDPTLSSKQLSYLTNGLKYVPSCQNRFSGHSIDKIIEQEYQNVVKRFKTKFHDNCISISDQRARNFFTAIENLFRQLYTTPLPRRLQARAQHEQNMIRSIRRQLKKSNVIIRPTDKSKVFYLGSVQDYNRKALEYMEKTNAYEEISTGINPYLDHLQAVLTLMDPLLKKKAIDLKLWKQQMRPDPKTIELAHLYFIPKPHKIDTPLRPIVSSMRAASNGVAHFLDQVLRPLYYRITKSSTFINDIDFIRQLEEYRDQRRLLPTTLFITFDVTDLYTMIPRDGTLAALSRFLIRHSQHGKINEMTIDTLMKMTRLVLNTNGFAFQNQYYQQIRGGAMGSPLTMTLANIYMYEWEQPLIEYQKSHNELYGRYIDDVFMTTNSFDELNIILNQMEQKDENIQITRSIGSTIEFLDVLISNDHGQLKTSVFHKPAAEPYLLPFSSEHPRHTHFNTIKGALLRAIRLCSNVDDFDHERLHIELKLLLNGYPLKYITYQFKRFFEQHNAYTLISEQPNEIIYQVLHKKLLDQISRRQKQYNKIISNDNNILQQQQQPSQSTITIHFTFESGPMLKFKQELRRLWEKFYIYPGSPMNNVRLQIGTRSNKSLCQLLVKKKPPKSMLTNSTLELMTTSTTTTTNITNS